MRMNCSQAFERQTYANYLQAAGYKTAYFGKYLNPPAMARYCNNGMLGPLLHGWPPGWDVFYGMCDQASTPKGGYYDMQWINSETEAIEYTGEEPSEYTTSIIGNKTVAYLRHQGELRQKLGLNAAPFFMAAAVRAPHAPQLPPPWYADALPDAAVVRGGSYNSSTEGKPDWFALNPPLSHHEAASFDHVFAQRWRSLLAVDDLVHGVVTTLSDEGLLDSTFVFFTSDNGFHFGHFRLPPAKAHVYEFDVRVPLLVRGPGVRINTEVHELIGNVDLAPTFLDIAGLDWRALPMDGRSLLPILRPQHELAQPWRSVFPLEFFSLAEWRPHHHARVNDNPNNTYRAIRIVNATHDLLYSETTIVSDWWFEQPYFHELYDMSVDPEQLRNILPDASDSLRYTLQQELIKAWACSGKDCSGHEDVVQPHAYLDQWV